MSSSGSKGTIQTNEEVIEELTRDIGGVRTDSPEKIINENDNNASASDEDKCKFFVDEELIQQRDSLLSEDEIQKLREEAEVLKDEGNKFYKEKNYEEATMSYTKALRTCPMSCGKERSILYANRAASKNYFLDKESAIADCEKAVELDPTYIKAHLRSARLYEEVDRLDQALASFKKILEFEPKHIEALVAVKRLEPIVHERNEKLKKEMFEKLKDLGNTILRPFGLSTRNFQVKKDETSGSYSINFNQNPS